MKIRTMLFCGALVAMGAACNQDRLDEQADKVVDKQDDVARAQRHADEARAESAKQSVDVAKESANLASAEADFSTRRDEYVQVMRQRFRLYVAESGVTRGLLSDDTMTAADHQNALDKAMAFDREVAEAEQAIDALATATAAQWDAARFTVDNAFSQLDTAANDAFEAVSVDRSITKDVPPMAAPSAAPTQVPMEPVVPPPPAY